MPAAKLDAIEELDLDDLVAVNPVCWRATARPGVAEDGRGARAEARTSPRRWPRT